MLTLYPQKLALTSSTSGSRSVGIVRLRTKATEFFAGHRVREILSSVICPVNFFFGLIGHGNFQTRFYPVY
jgi:hypothetical protein